MSYRLSFCLAAAVALSTLVACNTQKPAIVPTIQFSHIPPAAQGGRERLDTISGTVTGAGPGQNIVIYAHSGPWWVQPWPEKPLIPIQADSTWSTETHLGFEYAALLVDSGYQPPPTLDVLPERGGTVSQVLVTKGTGDVQLAPVKMVHFSGYDWRVRTIASDRGGLNNLYNEDNAWVDGKGALHLKIYKKGDKWSCAEVVLDHSLGYGTYTTVVRDVSKLEPSTVLGFVTFDDWGGEQHYREMDAEFGRWGDASRKTNAQFGIQPFFVPANVAPFDAPVGELTSSMQWQPDHAKFRIVRGDSMKPGAPVVFEHAFDSGVPTRGRETYQFLFYVVASDKSPQQQDAEVVIEKFQYLP
jgi:hypothetical protein